MNTVVKISSLKRSWYKKLPANKTTVLFLSMVYVTFYLKPIYYCYNLDTSNNPPPRIALCIVFGRHLCSQDKVYHTRNMRAWGTVCSCVFSTFKSVGNRTAEYLSRVLYCIWSRFLLSSHHGLLIFKFVLLFDYYY